MYSRVRFFALLLSICAVLVALSGCRGLASSPSPSGSSGSGAGSSSQPAPTVSFTATPPSVTAGQSTTLTWQTTNATSVTITPSVSTSSLPVNGSVQVSPTTNTTYQITASGPGGTATA